MRFGKRSRTLAAAGRRFLGNPRDMDDDAVVAEERNALLEIREEEETMVPPSVEESSLSGDPIQLLLTALGRFQRQVAKAEQGAPAQVWSDECMEQLIAGIEVAYSQAWQDVQEAMTDAARILQSCENAGTPAWCVPFLQDSYEILCLMVGDLIVDNVRSGVIDKWRQRYRQAEEDLVKANIPLIEDDRPDACPAHVLETREDEAGFVYAALNDEVPPIDSGDSPWDDESVADDVPESVEETPLAVPEEETHSESPLPEMASPFDFPPSIDEPSPSNQHLPSLDGLLAGNAGQRNTPGKKARAGAPENLELSLWIAADEGGDETRIDAGAADACSLGSCDESQDEPAAEDDFSEELGMPGAEPGMDSAPEAAPERLQASAQETESALMPLWESTPLEMMEPTGPPAVSETCPEDAPRESEGSAPQAADPAVVLLQTAQAAMARGDVADAKMTALQLAVAIAQMEVSGVESRLSQAEDRLETTGHAIEEAAEAVRRAEDRVQAMESQIADRENEFQSQRGHMGALREQTAEVEQVLADLDAQIRALQAQRIEETKRLEALRTDMDEASAQESRIQTELEELSEAEQAARDALEECRQQAAQLAEDRNQYAETIARTQKELQSRRNSMADIERLIAVVGGTSPAAKPSQENDMLF